MTEVPSDWITNDSEASAVMAAWKSGFPSAPPVLRTGRATWPLPDRLRQGLLQWAPADGIQEIVAATDPKAKSYNKTLSQVLLWGYAGTLKNSGSEAHSMAALRFHEEGQRQVVIANVAGVAAYLREEAKPRIAQVTVAHLASMMRMMDEVAVQTLRARGVKVWHAIIKPSELLYQPCGYWVCERPLNGQAAFGVRTSWLRKARRPANRRSFDSSKSKPT